MSEYFDSSQTSEFVRDNIVKIIDKSEKFYGTGFFLKINQKQYCITCHHCIYKLDDIFISANEKKYHCIWNEEYSNMVGDIAVLSIEDQISIKPLMHNLQMLPRLKTLVWGFSAKEICHFPKGTLCEDGDLSISSVTMHWDKENNNGDKKWNQKPKVNIQTFKFNGQFDKGFSGAPVCYTEDKKVIGIFTAKDGNNGYVIPIQFLLSQFQKNTEIIQSISDSTYISKQLNNGNILYDQRKFKDSIEEYNKGLNDPIYLSALSNKGRCLAQIGANTKAIEIFNMVLDINPYFIYALNGMGLVLSNLRRYAEALKYCNIVLDIDPNNKVALTNKGSTLSNLGRYTEALEYHEKALLIDPNYFVAIVNKGNTLHRMEKYEKALECHDAALEINPNDKTVLSNKALSLHALGKPKEALELCEKAILMDPDDENLLCNKSAFLVDSEKYEEALKWCDKVLMKYPKNTNVLINKAYALWNMERYKEALEWFEKTLLVDPNNDLALKGISLCDSKLKSYKN